jgi:hypothetical protein
MPAISEQDALAVAAGLPHLKPEEQQEATRLLQRYQHQQEHERGEALFPSIEEQRKKDREAFYGIFADPKKVKFGNPLLSSALPYIRDQDTARKREASVRFLQDRYQRDEQEIRESLPLYMASYASENWDEPSLTDPARFFDFAKTEIEEEQATSVQMDEAARAGARAGMQSTPRLQAMRQFQAENASKPGYSPQALKVFGVAYDQYTGVIRKNGRFLSDLMGSMHDTPTGEPNENLPYQAINLIADLRPRDRRILMQALVTRGKQMGEKAPGKGWWQQFGESAGRTFSGMFLPHHALALEPFIQQVPDSGSFDSDIPFLNGVETAVNFLEEQADAERMRRMVPHSPQNQPKQFSRELSDVEQVALKRARDVWEKRFMAARELDSIAQMADPVESVTASTFGSSGALLLGGALGAAHPALWGSSFLATSAGYSNLEYNNLRLEYRDMTPEAASAIANASGVTQAFLDKLGFGFFAKAPSVKRLIGGEFTKEILTRVGIRAAGVTVVENVAEAGQDLAAPIVQTVLGAIKKDMQIPGVNWDDEWKTFGGSRLDVFLGLLPLTAIGVGFSTASDFVNGTDILMDNYALGAWGATEQDRVKIIELAHAGKMDEAQAALQDAFKRRSPEIAKQFQGEIDSQKAEVDQLFKDAERIGLIPKFTRDREGFSVRSADGATVRVKDWSEAREIAAQYMTDNELAEADAVARMGEHFIGQNREGEAQSFTIDRSQSPTIAPQPEAAERTEPEAVESTIVAGQLAGMTREQAQSETWHILGANNVEQRENVRHLASTIFREGNILTAIHEPIEARWKAGLESGRYTREQGLTWVRMAEKATGLSFLPMEDAEVLAEGGNGLEALTEAISDAVVTDSLSRRKDGTRLPAGVITEGMIAAVRRTVGARQQEAVKFSHFLRAWRALFRQVFSRARSLAQARAAGKLGNDYDSFLDDLLGVDVQTKRDTAVIKEAAAIAASVLGDGAPKLGETFSLRPGELQMRLERLFNPIHKDPAMRRLISQEGARRLRAMRQNIDREVVTKHGKLITLRGEGLDQLTERNRSRGNIESEARFRQASALERILKGMGLDTKDATRSKDSKDYERLQRYQESMHLLVGSGLTELEAEPLAQASAQKWRDNLVQDVRAAIAQAKAEAAKWKESELAKLPTDRDLISGWSRALDAVLSVLPHEVRGKVLGRANAYTRLTDKATDEARLKELEKTMRVADEELEDFLKKDLTERITELLEEKAAPGKTDRGVTESKLTPEAQRYLTEARAVWQMSRGEVEEHLNSLDLQIQQASDPTVQAELLARYDAGVRFGSLAAKDAEGLASALSALEDVYREGRAERAAQEAARKKVIQGLISQGKADVGAPVGSTDVDLVKRALSDQKWRNRLLRQAKGMVSENVLAFEHQLSRIFGEDSAITRHFSDALRVAHNKHQGLLLDMERQYHALLARLTDSKPDTFAATRKAVKLVRRLRLLQEKTGVVVNFTRETESRVVDRDIAEAITANPDLVDAYGYTSSEAASIAEALQDPDNAKRRLIPFTVLENAGQPEEMPMSHMNAAHYLLTWAQEAGREQMERDGWTEENIQQVRDFIDPRALQLMVWLAEKYQVDGYELANPVYRRVFHMDMPRTKNYAPLRRKASGTDQSLSIEEMEMTKASATPSMLIGRVTNRAPIARVDALTVFWQHWNGLSYWVAFGETIRDMQAVFRNVGMQDSILAKHGDEKLKGLSNRIEEARTGGAGAAYTLGAIDRIAQNITKGRVFSALVGNIGTLMKQTPALLNHFLATDLPNTAILHGWAKLMSGQLDLSAMWTNPAIQRRLEGRFTAEQRAAMSRPGESPNLVLLLMEKGMLPIRWLDAGWNVAGAAIAWDYYKTDAMRNGMSEPEAEVYANDSTDRMLYNNAQPDAQAARGMISNQRNSFLPFIWLFNTEPMQKAGIAYMMWRRIFSGKATAVDARQFGTLYALQPAVLWAMSGLYRYALGDDEAEDAWDWGDLLVAMTLGPASGIMFFGDAVGSVLRRVSGAKSWATSPNPMVSEAVRGNYWSALLELVKSFFPEAAVIDVAERMAKDGIQAIENGADLIEDGEKR